MSILLWLQVLIYNSWANSRKGGIGEGKEGDRIGERRGEEPSSIYQMNNWYQVSRTLGRWRSSQSLGSGVRVRQMVLVEGSLNILDTAHIPKIHSHQESIHYPPISRAAAHLPASPGHSPVMETVLLQNRSLCWSPASSYCLSPGPLTPPPLRPHRTGTQSIGFPGGNSSLSLGTLLADVAPSTLGK